MKQTKWTAEKNGFSMLRQLGTKRTKEQEIQDQRRNKRVIKYSLKEMDASRRKEPNKKKREGVKG